MLLNQVAGKTTDAVTLVAAAMLLETEIRAPRPARGKTAGNSIPPCVCNGRPSASRIEIVAADEAPTVVVKPGTRQATTELAVATADGADRRRISEPLSNVNIGETITLLTFKFEHVVPAAKLLLKEAKRRPVTDMVVKAMPAGTANVTVNVTFEFR